MASFAVSRPDFLDFRTNHARKPGIIPTGREDYVGVRDVGEAVEGPMIKWFLLAGMFGSVVCAFMVA